MKSINNALLNFAKHKKELAEINAKIANLIFLSEEDAQYLPDRNTVPFNQSYWLHMAYKMGSDCQDDYGPYDRYFINHENDVEGYLAENCKHALEAHLLIQKRKDIKKRFGIAKAVISRMATKLLKEQGVKHG